MYRLIILFFFTIFCFRLNGKAQNSENLPQLLDRYLAIQQKRIGFNGVVLIAKADTILYHEAIGKASFELNAPLTVNSKFKIASVSKSITAMLVTLAVDEGKLHLNDSLALFFPALKGAAWRNITIGQLLSHRSGIPHNEGIADYWTLKSLLPLNSEQSVAEIFKTKLLFEPGTSVKYSSPGYFLLATILEDAYQQSFAQLLRKKITDPLQMNHTGVYNTTDIIPGMAASYHLYGDSLIIAPYRHFSLMKGSGDLYATADDLLRWLRSFSGGRWSETIRSQIFSPHSGKPLHNNDQYGFGWFIRSLSDESPTAYYHGGGTYGCSSICVWYPEENIAVIILSNVSVLPVNELWADIENIIFQRTFRLPEIKKYSPLSPDELRKFEGNYLATSGGMQLIIKADNKHLFAKLGSNPPFEIYNNAAMQFSGKRVNVTFTFYAGENGTITSLQTNGRGQTHIFYKK